VSDYEEETDLNEAKNRCYNLLRELQEGSEAFKSLCSHKRSRVQKVWVKTNYAQTKVKEGV